MKKALALVLVLVSMALFAGVSFAEIGDIGGLVPRIRTCSYRQSAL